MAIPGVSYHMAQEKSLPNTPTHIAANINNIEDTGAGIAKFLWKEELEQRRKDLILSAVPERDLSSAIRSSAIPSCGRAHSAEEGQTIKIKTVRFAFWNTKGMAHITAREK